MIRKSGHRFSDKIMLNLKLRLPERLYDDPDELAVWAAHAFAIAERKKFKPRGRGKRKPPSKSSK